MRGIRDDLLTFICIKLFSFETRLVCILVQQLGIFYSEMRFWVWYFYWDSEFIF